MAENRFSVARFLCEFLSQEGVDCRLTSGELEVEARERASRDLLSLVARFCRERGLHLVQWRHERLSAVRAVLAWAGEAGEPGFLAARFRCARSPAAALGVWRRRPSAAIFGADEAFRRGLLDRVIADLSPVFRGALRLSSVADLPARTAGMRRWLPGPGLWALIDAPMDGHAERRKRDIEAAGRLWNATVVDASHGVPAAVVAIEWAILRYLEGRLEFLHPEMQAERNPLLARLLIRFCRRRTPLLAKLLKTLLNCDIYCRIWSPVLLAHPYGIVIHAGTVIGRRVTIMQQVTLGAKDRGVHAAPMLEDDVYVGSGAKVLGAVRVGRGATIGANAVVTRDVPAWCTVVGGNRIVRGEASGRQGEAALRHETS
jgi:serine O-acetyltransferase